MNPSPTPPPSKHLAPSKELIALVHSSEVTTLMENRIARAGIPESEQEDVLQNARIGILSLQDPPKDLEECSKAAHSVTTNKIADRQRKKYRAEKAGLVGPTDEADQHIDDEALEQASGRHAQQLALLREAQSDGSLKERDTALLILKRDGFTDAQIAEKLGMATQTVSNRIAAIRKTMRQRWQKRMVQLGAMALAVLALLLAWKKKEQIASFFFPSTVTPVPAPAPQRPEPERSIPVAVQGEELRRQATAKCDALEFVACSDLLEKAAKLDPVGDQSPEARELRHTVEDHVRPERIIGAKPGDLR